MSQLIVLIQPAFKVFTFQVNRHAKLETFNIAFSQSNNQIDISLPSMSSAFSIYGSSHTDTITSIAKDLPKIKTFAADIPQFIAALAKKYKVDCYQINVSSCFDDSMVKPFSVSAVLDIVENLKRFDFSLEF